MKMYLIMATGAQYFLTPCVIIKASCETAAIDIIKEHNPDAARLYRLVAERVEPSELEEHLSAGALVAETSDDIKDAF